MGCVPLQVAVRNLNGDGDLDLVTGDAGGSSVSVRFNQVNAVAARASTLEETPASSPLRPPTDGNPLRQLTGQGPVRDTPSAMSLEIFLNPVTAATHVCLVLPQDEGVSLQLYNALGQFVATLYEGPATAAQVLERLLAAWELPTGVTYAASPCAAARA